MEFAHPKESILIILIIIIIIIITIIIIIIIVLVEVTCWKWFRPAWTLSEIIIIIVIIIIIIIIIIFIVRAETLWLKNFCWLTVKLRYNYYYY